MNAETPQGHVEVQSYNLADRSQVMLTRKGKAYFVQGRPVTLRKALLWMAKMEQETESGSADWREVSKLLTACAGLLPTEGCEARSGAEKIIVWGKRINRKPPFKDGWPSWDHKQKGWNFWVRPPVLKLKQRHRLN